MWRIAFIPLIFASATALLLYVVSTLPKMKSKEVIPEKDDDVIISGERIIVAWSCQINLPSVVLLTYSVPFLCRFRSRWDSADWYSCPSQISQRLGGIANIVLHSDRVQRRAFFLRILLILFSLRVQADFLHSRLGLLEFVGRSSFWGHHWVSPRVLSHW